MADLARQVADFGTRLAALERQSDGLVDELAGKMGDVHRRLEQIGRSVAAVEAHDTRQNDRLARIEARLGQHDTQIADIEQTLGVLGDAAVEVASQGPST